MDVFQLICCPNIFAEVKYNLDLNKGAVFMTCYSPRFCPFNKFKNIKLIQLMKTESNIMNVCNNYYQTMYIVLDKPSLSFKKITQQLPGKQINIYTNQLQRVSRGGIISHLTINNKFSVFHLQYTTSHLSPIQKQRFMSTVYIRTADIKSNLIIDQLLENDEDLNSYKIQYPLILQFKIIKLQNTISSLTTFLSLESHFKIISKIGEGSFAEIYLARELGTEYLRAIKVIDKRRCMKLGELTYITNQITVLRQLQSPWQIKLYYVFQDNSNVYLVTEYCPYGDLFSELSKNSKTMTVFTKYTYIIQICLQICRLHQKGYIYRDLKPENILIDSNGNAKLCDFGYAMKFNYSQVYFDICGSYEYLPPEMIDKEGYNHTYDIYCIGLLFYEMLTGVNPFKGINSKNLQEAKMRKIDYNIEGIQSSVKDLLKRMLEKDPRKRIGSDSSAQIFRHQFFVQNGDMIVRILKQQNLKQRQTKDIGIKNMVPRSENKKQGNEFKNPPNILGGRIYNYLTVDFNVTEKMGPKMIPIDSRGNKGQEQ